MGAAHQSQFQRPALSVSAVRDGFVVFHDLTVSERCIP